MGHVVAHALKQLQKGGKGEAVNLNMGLMSRITTSTTNLQRTATQNTQKKSSKESSMKGKKSLRPSGKQANKSAPKPTKDQLADYQKAFSAFDRDKDGTINASELGTMMKSMGMFPSEQDLKAMILSVDGDGSGHIEFDEFVNLMQGANGAHNEPASNRLAGGRGGGDVCTEGASFMADLSTQLAKITGQVQRISKGQATVLQKLAAVEKQTAERQQKANSLSSNKLVDNLISAKPKEQDIIPGNVNQSEDSSSTQDPDDRKQY
jgi:hypothetical protein